MNGWTIGSALRGSTSARALIIALAPIAMASAAIAGPVLPTDGQYVAGSGTIAKKTGGLTINQSSNTGIINWSSFSVGKGTGIQFNNGTGATLNRVTGGNLSTIAGSLKATGSLYLINPEGVIVSGSGRVITGGTFAASSRGTSGDDFMNGRRLRFSGVSKGNVVNSGKITAGGDAILIGHAVGNSGTVSAANGTASLNAGNSIYLAPAGSNGRILVRGLSGDVTNRGTISAAQAQLNAAGGNVYALSGNNGGIIRATGTRTVNGHVWLSSDTGNVSASGTVIATNANGSGGRIDVTARNIALGGTLNASATTSSRNGGRISVVSKNTTKLTGSIKAQGGSHGDGGFIETSGEHVRVAGSTRVNTLAPSGRSGTWLIDPNDYTIAATGGDITGATLSSNLSTTDVTISSDDGATSGNGDIFVNDVVTSSAGHTLELDAVRDIDVNAKVTISGGMSSLVMTTGRDLNFVGTGRIAFVGYADDTSTNLSINGDAYTLENSVAALANAIDNNDATGRYALADNYDASADGTYSAAPITTGFTGTFEGLGNTISNLAIADTNAGDAVGLFAEIDGTARDLHLANVNVTGTGGSSGAIGSLAGNVDGTISNVTVSGKVVVSDGNGSVGGLAGFTNNATIDNATAAVSVSGGANADIGGLVGFASFSTISNSSATGAVAATTGADTLGGFVGYINGASTMVSGSHASGTVTQTGTANSGAGGFAGNVGGVVDTSYATGNVSAGGGSPTGGFAGQLNGASALIENSYATGSVAGGNGYTGGFAGQTFNGGEIRNSYTTGDVSGGGGQPTGGFVGFNRGVIDTSYATGTVTGSAGATGGFVGENDTTGTIDQSYSTGAASGGLTVGGFAGQNDNTSGLSASIADYYNTTANTGGGIGSDSGTSNVHGLSLSAMGTATNFSGWTFGTTAGDPGWVIVDLDGSLNNGEGVSGGTTPLLLTEYSTTITNAHQLQLMTINPNANYMLANDIDASGTAGGDVWLTHGFDSIQTYFGTLDGAGHVISGLTDKGLIPGNGGSPRGGLFYGIGGSGVVENLGLSAVAIDSQTFSGTIGALADTSQGTISNVWVSGTLTAAGNSTFLGGLVGTNGGTISNSRSSATVSVAGNTYAGGLVAENDGTISNSYATGAVSGGAEADVGGLVGFVNTGATITGSYATGTVTAGDSSAYGGGLVGFDQGAIVDSYATGNVSGGVNFTGGGLAGFIGIGGPGTPTATGSYATGNVIGGDVANVGGFVGRVASNGVVNHDWASGNATSTFGSSAGGFVGVNFGAIDHAYALGDARVGNTADAGGFAGTNSASGLGPDGTIDESYSSGTATGGSQTNIGGFVGQNNSTSALTISVGDYYNSANNSTGVGLDFHHFTDDVHGLDMSSAPNASDFSEWSDFGTTGGDSGWVIVDADGSFNNAGSAASGTLPVLLTEYTTTIANAHQLQLMELDPTANYTLNNSIDASATGNSSGIWQSTGFVAVGGNSAGHFTGTFDGAGHTISGLAMDDSSETFAFNGMFGYLDTGSIVKNVTLTGASLAAGGDDDSGILAGDNFGTISGVVVSGTYSHPLIGTGFFGGLVGNNGGTIQSSGANVAMTLGSNSTAAHLGGLVGDSSGTVSNSYATGSVTGTDYSEVGGLVGKLAGGTIDGSYATGAVSGGDYAMVGGLVGKSDAGTTISNSHATGNVTDTTSDTTSNTNVGGLVGENGNIVETSYATGNVSGGHYVGGLIGDNDVSVTTSYATGSVTGGEFMEAGGLVGNNDGSVTYSYATGNVTAGFSSSAGGVVGYAGTVSYSYATGAIAGATYQGGISAGGTNVSHSYWDTDTTGQAQSGGNTNEDASTYGLSDADMRDSTKLADFNFGTDWVIVDQNGTTDNFGGAAGGTTPMLLSEYSTTITNAHQLQLIALHNAANYTLANDIDASGTAGGDVWDAHGFGSLSLYGTFDGAGHSIAGLTQHTGNAFAGLFGYLNSSGVVENVALTGANIDTTGTSYAGILVGISYGTVTRSSASGTISGTADTGGLVGENNGTITLSSSSANISEGNDSGGLVGLNFGSISQSYATGSVFGDSSVGGFVGLNSGTITQSYATGSASGGSGSHSGGFVGTNNFSIDQSYSLGVSAKGFAGESAGGITNSYWDTDTSGTVQDGSGGFVTGETTTQLQAALPSGFDGSAWKIIPGQSFAYLGWQFANVTPVAVNGTAYSDGGVTKVGAGTGIDLIGNGGSTLDSVSTFADGSFHALLGNLASTGVLAQGEGIGRAFSDKATLSGLRILGSGLNIITADANFSTLAANIGMAGGAVNFGTMGDVTIASAGNFDVDQGLNVGANHLTLSVNGSLALDGNLTSTGIVELHDTLGVTQNSGIITAHELEVFSSGNSVTLNGANNIATLGTVEANGGGNLSLTDAATVTLTDYFLATNAGHVSLTTTGAGHGIVNNGTISTAGTVTLISAAGISSANGVISALTLTGSSNGAVTLTNASNHITFVDAFTTGGNNAFSLTDAQPLVISGAVSVGSGALTLTSVGNITIDDAIQGGTVTLSAGTGITSFGSGKITATTLTGVAHGLVDLNGANVVTNLGAFTTNGNTFSLADAHDLTITGAVNTGTGTLNLTTTGAGQDIIVDSTLHGGIVNLVSAATISSNANGKITTTTLIGSSHGAVSLTAANTITNLGAFTTGGNNAFALTDAHDLTVSGAVNAGTAGLTLTTTGAGNDIILHGTLHGGTVKLASGAAISATAAGKITATTLIGSSHGTVSLAAANVITNLGAFSTGGNNAFALTDAHDLTVGGAVNAGTAGLTLTTTGTGNDILVDSTLHGGTVKLASAGKITANANGKITATTLTGTSHGAVSLAAANTIANLGAFSTGGNNAFALTDTADLSVTGAVNAGTGGLTLKTTGAGHDLAIKNVLTGGTAVLTSAGTIVESGSGVLHAATLTGSSVGGASLTGANLIATLGNFANTGAGNFSLKDDKALTVSGAVSVASTTGTLGLTTTVGNLTINGSLKAPTVTLVTAGELLEGAAGSVTATKLLNVTAKTGINLNSTHNHIKAIGTRHTNSGPNTINGVGQ